MIPTQNPARAVSIEFTSSLSGALTLELFDVWGRRLESSQQLISDGQSGTFQASRPLASGIYYYSGTLSPIAGSPIVLRGRLSIVR